MVSPKILPQLFCLSGILSFFPVLLGAAFSGGMGALVGLFLSLFVVAVVAMTSERIIVQAYSAHSRIPAGLGRSLDLVLGGTGRTSPRILIYAEPYPNALVVRQLGGAGSILVSQGMVALLNDVELREVMKMCLVRLKEPTLVFQSLSSVFAMGVLSLIPSSWSQLVFAGKLPGKTQTKELGPFSTLVFLILFPVVQFFLNTGGLRSRIATKKSASSALHSFSMQKMASLIPLFEDRQRHGTASLYIIHM